MKKYRFIVMALLLIFVNGTVYALSVSTTSDPNVLVNNILGSGLTAVGGSPTYSGDAVAAGTFTGGISSGIGIDSGILFSTGAAADAVGPNTNGYDSSEVLGGTGTNADAFDDATRVNSGINNDAQLNALAGVNTYDGAILEFNYNFSARKPFLQFCVWLRRIH